jgi:hypothetical protein
MWNVYADDDPNHPAKPNENAMPGLAPTTAPGPDHVELVVDGEKFVVTRRTGSGTYDRTSDPASYGLSIGSNADWHPDRADSPSRSAAHWPTSTQRHATCAADPDAGGPNGHQARKHRPLIDINPQPVSSPLIMGQRLVSLGSGGRASRLPSVHPAGVRIVCDQDRKNEQSEMTWVKRFIVFLVVGFFLFYLVTQPEAAANAVRGVIGGIALVFRSILIFFQALTG